MATEAEKFKAKMQSDSSARAKFVSDVKAALKAQGVNVDDAAVLKQFGLHADHAHIGNLNSASTYIVTNTA